MSSLKLGIVGLGAIFQMRHAPALAEIPEAVVSAVADVNENLARETGRRYGCSHTADYRELFADDSVDAVFVCTPPFLHEEVAVAAAQAHKHVFCEKPLAPTLDACDRIIDAAAEAAVKLMVAENWLFDPLTLYLKECVADGRFGKLRRLRFMQAWSGPDQERFYRSSHPGRNGVFLEDGIHMIAMSRALLGTVRSVAAIARTVRPTRDLPGADVVPNVEDDMTVTLAFDEATAVNEVTWLVDVGGLHSEFLFERATIAVLNPGWNAIHVTATVKTDDGDVVPLALPDFAVRTPVSPSSYRGEVHAFVRCVLDDTPSPYPGEEGRQDVRLVALAYEAAEHGRTLPVS